MRVKLSLPDVAIAADVDADRVPVTIGFSHQQIVGYCSVRREADGVYADLDMEASLGVRRLDDGTVQPITVGFIPMPRPVFCTQNGHVFTPEAARCVCGQFDRSDVPGLPAKQDP